MHQYRSRPAVDCEGQVVPWGGADLPALDIFAIKLFSSGNPCTRQKTCSAALPADPVGPVFIHMRVKLQARGELGNLSVQITEFLSRVSSLGYQHQVNGLLELKARIRSAPGWRVGAHCRLQIDTRINTPVLRSYCGPRALRGRRSIEHGPGPLLTTRTAVVSGR